MRSRPGSRETTVRGAAVSTLRQTEDAAPRRGLADRPCQYQGVHIPSLLALLGGIIFVSATLLALFLIVFSRPRGEEGTWNRDGLQSAGLVFGCTVVAVLAFWWLMP